MKKSNIVNNIQKYYLGGLSKGVIWNIKNNKVNISFTTETKDTVGDLVFDLNLDDCEIGINNTDALLRLLSITDEILGTSERGLDSLSTVPQQALVLPNSSNRLSGFSSQRQSRTQNFGRILLFQLYRQLQLNDTLQDKYKILEVYVKFLEYRISQLDHNSEQLSSPLLLTDISNRYSYNDLVQGNTELQDALDQKAQNIAVLSKKLVHLVKYFSKFNCLNLEDKLLISRRLSLPANVES